MNTTFDQDTIIYKALAASSIKTAITGGIYKGSRPVNSKLEDVVVGSITIGDGSQQAGTCMVNIHVPDISGEIGGTQQLIIDTARLKALGDMAVTAIEDGFGANYTYWISSQKVLPDDTEDNHFVSLRVEFRFHNMN